LSIARTNIDYIHSSPFMCIRDDLVKVESLMETLLDSDDEIIREASRHLLRAGGKRIRPALVLLGARFAPGPPPLRLAAACELVHMATLVHDDVIDRARVRRGSPTLNERWDDRVAVLVGDHLFAIAFEVVAAEGRPGLVRSMADVVAKMSAGEISQMSHVLDLAQTQAEYMERIGMKTARFMGECASIGAAAKDAGEGVVSALSGFGYNLGLAFQIVDDVLDLAGDQAAIGKAVGTDLEGGVLTLPVIHALRHRRWGGRVRDLVTSAAPDAVEVARVLKRSGSLAYARRRAADCVRAALLHLRMLPPRPERTALERAAAFVLGRTG